MMMKDGGELKNRKEEAAVFLLKALANGPVDSKQLWEDAKAAGIKYATYKRAKEDLGTKALKQSDGHWQTALDSDPRGARGARCSSCSPNIKGEQLEEHLAHTAHTDNEPLEPLEHLPTTTDGEQGQDVQNPLYENHGLLEHLPTTGGFGKVQETHALKGVDI